MRSSLVLTALAITFIACTNEESKSAKSDWQCAPTAVHNGETVTCTTAGRQVATNEPQAPSGDAVYLRTYGVPTGDVDAGAPAPAPSGDGASASGSGDSSESNATPPSAPKGPDEYDCSSGGQSCPPADALPPPAAGSGDTTGSAAPGTLGGAIDQAATDYRCKTGDSTTTCTRKTIECKEGTMQVGDECLAAGEAPTSTTAPSGGGCTLTQGYWKTHPTKWPTQVLTIGGVAYTETELLAIFNTPPTGDASLILGHQLIAAMLNAAAGASQAQVGSAIQAAQAWMSANKDADGRLPYGVASTSPAGTAAVSISTTLDTYNNGGLDIPHCN